MHPTKIRFFDKAAEEFLGLTYDDVLVLPHRSDVPADEVRLDSRFSRNIGLRVPVVSAAMNTVTESDMAICLAQAGGLGVIHAGLGVEDQKREVRRVKLFLNGLIDRPITVQSGSSVREVLNLREGKRYPFHTFPVVDSNNKLVGVLTGNDIDFCENLDANVEQVMTPLGHIVSAPPGTSIDDAYRLMILNKKKTLPLVALDGTISGLYVFSDVKRIVRNDNALYNVDERGQLRVAAAIPTHDDAVERVGEMLHYLDVAVVDTAQGDSKYAFQTLEALKSEYPHLDVVVGNVSVADSARDLAAAGADGIKIGQGAGCFGAGTRVLMADATYKNIEDVRAGDRVINMHGQPVTVLKAWCTGVKDVMSVRHSVGLSPTMVTPDHRFWVGDLSTVPIGTQHSRGYVKLLRQPTYSGASKIGWQPVGGAERSVFLFPRQIAFEMPITFKINVGGFAKHRWHLDPQRSEVEPSYELGYVFGMFLGDGCSWVVENRNSQAGRIDFYLGKDESEAIDKLSKCLTVICGRSPVAKPQKTNMTILRLHSLPWARLFAEFGKRHEKHLPTKYLCSNKDYWQGLFDGLVDSDGNVQKDTGRISLRNTSKQIIELFSMACLKLHGSLPNVQERAGSAGGLKGVVGDCRTSYMARIGPRHTQRWLDDLLVVRNEGMTPVIGSVPVYDIEVDCPTHSFVADNVIVHNSICTTRTETGIGRPQLSAVYDCARAVEGWDIPVCADGGISQLGHISIAVAAGAHSVMLGRMLAGTDEAPGEVVTREDGSRVMEYRGMGSASAIRDSVASRRRYGESGGFTPLPEGVEAEVPYQGSASSVLTAVANRLRKGMSYVGSPDIEAHRRDALLNRVTLNGLRESHPHDVQVIARK